MLRKHKAELTKHEQDADRTLQVHKTELAKYQAELETLRQQQALRAETDARLEEAHAKAMSDAAAAGEESLRRVQLEIEEQLGLANAEVVRAQEEVVSLRAKHGCAVATLTLRSAELSKEENRVLLLTGQLASLRDAKDAALATVATQEDEIAAAHAHCSALSEQMELASAELRRQRDAAGSEANERSKQLERRVQEQRAALASERSAHELTRAELRARCDQLSDADGSLTSIADLEAQLRGALQRVLKHQAASGFAAQGANVTANDAEAEGLWQVVTPLLSAASRHAAADGYGRDL